MVSTKQARIGHKFNKLKENLCDMQQKYFPNDKSISKMSIKSDIFLRCELNDCKIDAKTKKI